MCLRPASIVLRAKSIRLKDLRQKVANHCGASCAPPPSAVAIWCSHKARAACRFKEVCLVPGTPRAVLSIYRQRPCSSAVTICRHAWKLPLNSIFNIDQYCSLMQFAAISTLFWFCAQRKTDGHIKKTIAHEILSVQPICHWKWKGLGKKTRPVFCIILHCSLAF